jgi:hypothetical protein
MAVRNSEMQLRYLARLRVAQKLQALCFDYPVQEFTVLADEFWPITVDGDLVWPAVADLRHERVAQIEIHQSHGLYQKTVVTISHVDHDGLAKYIEKYDKLSRNDSITKRHAVNWWKLTNLFFWTFLPFIIVRYLVERYLSRLKQLKGIIAVTAATIAEVTVIGKAGLWLATVLRSLHH